MQSTPHRRRRLVQRAESGNPYVTAAVGLSESSGLGLRRTRPGRLFRRTLVWVTALICLSLLLGSIAQAWSNNRLMQQLADARAQYQQTLARHQALQKLVVYYKDPFVIESEARQSLGYVRPGEHRVIIVSAPSSSPSPQPRSSPPAGGGGFWSAWWNLLFGS